MELNYYTSWLEVVLFARADINEAASLNSCLWVKTEAYWAIANNGRQEMEDRGKGDDMPVHNNGHIMFYTSFIH